MKVQSNKNLKKGKYKIFMHFWKEFLSISKCIEWDDFLHIPLMGILCISVASDSRCYYKRVFFFSFIWIAFIWNIALKIMWSSRHSSAFLLFTLAFLCFEFHVVLKFMSINILSKTIFQICFHHYLRKMQFKWHFLLKKLEMK